MSKEDELYALIDVLLESDKLFGLMVLGDAGIGKSYNVLKHLNDKGIEFDMFRTYSSPLALYTWLYENRDSDLIIMDDVDGIWENNHSAAILKSALWEDDNKERTIQWNTTKKDIPDREFIMNAKIIFICNKTRENPHIDAVLSRILHYKFEYTKQQKIEKMKEICAQRTGFRLDELEKLEIVDMIDKNASLFDFRTMIQGFAIMEHCKFNGGDWKSIFLSILQGEANKELKWVYDENQTGKTVEEQAADFKKTFGKSRRTFFYLRRRLRDNGCL